MDAVAKSEAPLKAFMLKQTRQDDLGLFLKLAGGETYRDAATTSRSGCSCRRS